MHFDPFDPQKIRLDNTQEGMAYRQLRTDLLRLGKEQQKELQEVAKRFETEREKAYDKLVYEYRQRSSGKSEAETGSLRAEYERRWDRQQREIGKRQEKEVQRVSSKDWIWEQLSYSQQHLLEVLKDVHERAVIHDPQGRPSSEMTQQVRNLRGWARQLGVLAGASRYEPTDEARKMLGALGIKGYGGGVPLGSRAHEEQRLKAMVSRIQAVLEGYKKSLREGQEKLDQAARWYAGKDRRQLTARDLEALEKAQPRLVALYEQIDKAERKVEELTRRKARIEDALQNLNNRIALDELGDEPKTRKEMLELAHEIKRVRVGVVARDVVFLSGKYAGRRMEEIPIDYLLWVAEGAVVSTVKKQRMSKSGAPLPVVREQRESNPIPFGEMIFRAVRKYLQTLEGRARLEKHYGDVPKIGQWIPAELPERIARQQKQVLQSRNVSLAGEAVWAGTGQAPQMEEASQKKNAGLILQEQRLRKRKLVGEMMNVALERFLRAQALIKQIQARPGGMLAVDKEKVSKLEKVAQHFGRERRRLERLLQGPLTEQDKSFARRMEQQRRESERQNDLLEAVQKELGKFEKSRTQTEAEEDRRVGNDLDRFRARVERVLRQEEIQDQEARRKLEQYSERLERESREQSRKERLQGELFADALDQGHSLKEAANIAERGAKGDFEMAESFKNREGQLSRKDAEAQMKREAREHEEEYLKRERFGHRQGFRDFLRQATGGKIPHEKALSADLWARLRDLNAFQNFLRKHFIEMQDVEVVRRLYRDPRTGAWKLDLTRLPAYIYKLEARINPNWKPHSIEWQKIAEEHPGAWIKALEIEDRIDRVRSLQDLEDLEKRTRDLFDNERLGVDELSPLYKYIANRLHLQRIRLQDKNLQLLDPEELGLQGANLGKGGMVNRLREEMSYDEHVEEVEILERDLPFPEEMEARIHYESGESFEDLARMRQRSEVEDLEGQHEANAARRAQREARQEALLEVYGANYVASQAATPEDIAEYRRSRGRGNYVDPDFFLPPVEDFGGPREPELGAPMGVNFDDKKYSDFPEEQEEQRKAREIAEINEAGELFSPEGEIKRQRRPPPE